MSYDSLENLIKPLQLLRSTVTRKYPVVQPQRSFKRLIKILFTEIKRPVFLVGAPRSGTTFLGECLSTIPFLTYHNEPSATKFASSLIWNEEWPKLILEKYYVLVYKLLLWTYGNEEKRFAEKTPRNCFIIPFLKELFPEAQFIHIIRDGRDVALSLSKKPWLKNKFKNSEKKEPGGYQYGPYPRYWVEENRLSEFKSTTDIHRCVWSWRQHVSHGIKYGRQLSSDCYLEVRYENFCANPIEVGMKIIKFLAPGMVSLPLQFTKKLELASERSIGSYITELNFEQLDQINKEAGYLLCKLDYK